MSPTQRSLALLRGRGAMAEVVERRIPRTHTTRDLFNFADIVAVEPGTPGVLAVQATSSSNVGARLKKFQDKDIAERIGLWLRAGNRLVVWGFAKRGPRGKCKRWTCREVEVTQ